MLQSWLSTMTLVSNYMELPAHHQSQSTLPLPLPPTLPPPFLPPSLHSGETVYTQLHGSANDVNVRLDRSSITLKDTFIGLSSQRSLSLPPFHSPSPLLLLLFLVYFSPRSVTLHNRSGVVVHYQWKAFGSRAEEEMQRKM